jgi:hypothetical protein
MAERIAGHFPDDDDLEKNLDASRIRREPWTQIIAANSRIGRVVGKLRDIAGTGSTYGRHWWKQLKPQAESVSELADIRVQDLLGCATSENAREVSRLVEQRVTPADERVLVEGLTSENDWQVWVCLRGLGEMKTPTACQAAMQFIVSHPETKGPRLGAATKAMAGAPASACLGIGRNWFQSPQWAFRYVAEGILEAHAEDADIPMLRAAVGVANATEDIYRLCSVIGCLKRFTNLGILPEVEQVFIDCQYSYARRRAARTMQKSCSERFADYWAFECMWDCESETRTIGCESVRLDAEAANNRLREILDDQYEADGVRACAKERLGR